MGRMRWILILCAWTIVGLLFAVRRIMVVKVQGTHVSWMIVGAPEFVYWYVWAAYTPICDCLAQTVPVDGAEVCSSYSDPHNHVLPDGSPGIGHRILSEPWTSCGQFFA